MFTLQFWEYNNRWRAIAFPLFLMLVVPTERLWWDPAYIPGGVLVLTYLLAVALGITRPSQIDYERPHYGAIGRIGFGLLYGFCWTAWALAVGKGFPLVVM